MIDVLLPVHARRRVALGPPSTPIVLDGALFRLEDDVTVGGVTGPNPLLRNSNTALAYDKTKAGTRTIRRESATSYKMWWEAVQQDAPGGQTNYVAYATSANGIDWTKYGSNPVMVPSLTWENLEVAPTSIVWDPVAAHYKLYFHGGNNSPGIRKIGLATSTDGITWTKDAGNPILGPGASGAFDDLWIADCKVVRLAANDWVMLYRGINASNVTGIGRATSTDGVTWTKDGTTARIAASGSGWRQVGVAGPTAPMIDASGRWHMWIVGTATGSVQSLGYVYSDDRGVSWTEGANNPVLVKNPETDSPDSGQVGDVLDVVHDGDKVFVVYGGSVSSGYTGTGGVPLDGISAAYLPRRVNSAASPARFFSAATDRVTLPTSVTLFDNAVYTLVARIKVVRDDTGSRLIYGESLAFNKEVNYRINATGKLEMLHRTPAAFASINGGGRLDDNLWHNVAIRRNGTSSFDLIADGTVIVSSSAAVGTTADVGTPAYGNWAASPGLAEPLQGSISRIALWDASALTLAEITAFCNNGTLPAAGNPSWWHDPGSGATEPDKSGNGKTGTLTGTTVVDGDPLAGVTP